MSGLTIRQRQGLAHAHDAEFTFAPTNHLAPAPRYVPPPPTVIEKLADASDALVNRVWFVASLGAATGAIFAIAAMGWM